MSTFFIEAYDETMSDPQGEWPINDDFNSMAVFFDEDIIREVTTKVGANKRCLIRGAEGRGKTVLSRIVARYFKQKGSKVFFADFQKLSRDESDHLVALVGSSEFQGKEVILVFENAQYAPSQRIVMELIGNINRGHASVIFTSREIILEEEDMLTLDPFAEWIEMNLHVDLKPDLSTASGIVDAFINSRKMQYSTSQEDERWMKNEFGKKLINLRRLRWYLVAWENKGGPLCTMSRLDVLKDVIDYFQLDELDWPSRRKLLQIAAVYQYDIPFIEHNQSDETILEGLVGKRVVVPLRGNKYRMQHSLDASYVVEAVAVRDQVSTEDLTLRILKEYVKETSLDPFVLFAGIRAAKHRGVMHNLLEDVPTFEGIRAECTKSGVTHLGDFLKCLQWSFGLDKALDVWLDFKKSLGDSPERRAKVLATLLDGASFQSKISLLAILKTLGNPEEESSVEQAINPRSLAQSMNDKDVTFGQVWRALRILPFQKSRAVISACNAGAIAAKAKGERLQKIMWFLRELKGFKEVKFIEAFAASLDLAALLRVNPDVSFGIIENLIELCPTEISKSVLSQLGPEELSKRALKSPLQKTKWFLRWSSRNMDKSFTNSFVNAKMTARIVQEARNTPYSVMEDLMHYLPERLADSLNPSRPFLRSIKASNAVHDDRLDVFPLSLELKSMLKSDLDWLTDVVLHFWQTGNARAAQILLRGLAYSDLGKRMRELNLAKPKKLLKVAGKLLYITSCVFVQTSKEIAEDIAQIVVENVSLANPNNFTLEELSLLLRNVRICDPSSYNRLLSRAFSSIDLTQSVGSRLDKGLVYLVNDISKHDFEEGKKIAEEIFRLDIADVVSKSQPKDVAVLLLNLMQIDADNTVLWISGIDERRWRASLLRCLPYEAYRLLWSLYHVREDQARRLACWLAGDEFHSFKAPSVENTVLLEFLSFCGAKLRLQSIFEPVWELAKKVGDRMDIAEIAFCVRAIERHKDEALRSFLEQLSRHSYIKLPWVSIQMLIDSHPFESTRNLLSNMLRGIALPKEPNSTLIALIQLWRDSLKEADKIKIKRSALASMCLSNPRNAPLLDQLDVKFWINTAVDVGVLLEKSVTNEPSTRRSMSLLSLNETNEFVRSHMLDSTT